MQNLGNLLKILVENNIEFVLIGGFAAAVHGSSQTTKDIDVCMMINPESVQKLRETLKDYHPVHRMTPQKLSFLDIPEDVTALKNIYLNTDLGPLDVLGFVSGLGEYPDVVSQTIEIPVFGHTCKVLSLEALIKAKQAMTGEKDKATVVELEEIQKNLPHKP